MRWKSKEFYVNVPVLSKQVTFNLFDYTVFYGIVVIILFFINLYIEKEYDKLKYTGNAGYKEFIRKFIILIQTISFSILAFNFIFNIEKNIINANDPENSKNMTVFLKKSGC